MEDNNKKDFMFQDYLVNCDDAIKMHMKPAKGRLYRLVHNPTVEKDLLPTSLWEYNTPIKSKQVKLGNVLPKGSPIEDQESQLGEYLPSFNLTDDGAVAPFLGRYKKKSPEQREQFLLNKGSRVVGYDVTPEDGRMWVQDSGHVLLQPYKGFKLDEHVAAEFRYKHLDEYLKD